MFNSVSREYIARLESGKHDPPLSRIEKIAAALRVKVFKLIVPVWANPQIVRAKRRFSDSLNRR